VARTAGVCFGASCSGRLGGPGSVDGSGNSGRYKPVVQWGWDGPVGRTSGGVDWSGTKFIRPVRTVNKNSPFRPVRPSAPSRPVGHPWAPLSWPSPQCLGAPAGCVVRQLFTISRAARFGVGRPGGDDEVQISLLDRPATPARPRVTTTTTKSLPTQNVRFGSHSGGARDRLFMRFCRTKNARWDDEVRSEHFLTKPDPICARRVCKKGPLKGGRFGGGQILSDIPPRPGRGRSPLRGHLVEKLGTVGHDSRAAFSSCPRGTVAVRSRPALLTLGR
jgi:hypothetical protein